MRLLLVVAIAVASACAHAPPPAPASSSALAPLPAASPSLAARIGDRVVTLAEVDEAAKVDIHQARTQALEKIIDEAVIDAAAKKAGKTPRQLLDDLAAARVPEVTTAEAQQYYDRNKSSLPEQLAHSTFTEIAPLIIRGLTEQRREQALRSIVGEMRDAAKVQVLLEPPRIDVAPLGPSRGPAQAKVTIIEFSDFQCPYCARAQPVVQELLKRYGDDVRLVFRDFPLEFHGDAAHAAEASHCADELGKFWALHDWMFDNQHNLSVDEIKQAASSLGLDRARFDKCLDSGKYRDVVATNHRDGERAGVTGTPAFFINGVMLKGALPLEEFKLVIDRALSR
jgi:protein-disulfide isomerase